MIKVCRRCQTEREIHGNRQYCDDCRYLKFQPKTVRTSPSKEGAEKIVDLIQTKGVRGLWRTR